MLDDSHNNPTEQQRQPQPVLEYATPEPKASRIATASVVCGWSAFAATLVAVVTIGNLYLPAVPVVLSIWIGGSLLAIALGIVGLSKKHASAPEDRSRSRRGVILGCVNLGVLLLLMLLRPHTSGSSETANRIKCASNLRQIGQAIMLYAQGKDERYPQRLDQLITASDLSPKVCVCPSSNDEEARGASMQEQLAEFAKPGRCSYIYTGSRLNSSSPANAVLAYEPLKNHEDNGINILFNDGHVEWLGQKQAAQVIAELESGQNPPPALGPSSHSEP